MAGVNPSDPGFDAGFRAKIRAAMLMGTPVAVADRPTFQFGAVRVFASADGAGEPFDWSQPGAGDVVSETVRGPVQQLCAVETGPLSESMSSAGPLDEGEANIYLFEDEFASVEGFDTVLLGRSTYRFVARLNPLSLFGVQVEVVKVQAVDES